MKTYLLKNLINQIYVYNNYIYLSFNLQLKSTEIRLSSLTTNIERKYC